MVRRLVGPKCRCSTANSRAKKFQSAASREGSANRETRAPHSSQENSTVARPYSGPLIVLVCHAPCNCARPERASQILSVSHAGDTHIDNTGDRRRWVRRDANRGALDERSQGNDCEQQDTNFADLQPQSTRAMGCNARVRGGLAHTTALCSSTKIRLRIAKPACRTCCRSLRRSSGRWAHGAWRWNALYRLRLARALPGRARQTIIAIANRTLALFKASAYTRTSSRSSDGGCILAAACGH